MIRLGKKLRLTRQKDIDSYRALTGRANPPQTIDEMNAALDDGARAWRAVGSAEGELLGVLADAKKLKD